MTPDQKAHEGLQAGMDADFRKRHIEYLVKKSALIDDLDKALLPLQEELGVTDGGHASIFWSGPDGETWATDPVEVRIHKLEDYVVYEIMQKGENDE